LPGKEASVPALTEVTTVRLATTGGEVVVEIYPQAAPNAAQRFVELVTSGYYDDTPVSRVVQGFVAQFGINWRDPHKAWEDRPFNDDPTLFALERGTLALAKAGPNTNSTQVFISYRENNRLAEPQFNFTVFGKVASSWCRRSRRSRRRPRIPRRTGGSATGAPSRAASSSGGSSSSPAGPRTP
jgi:cyclophilin family peptidyl-prolyl cis-trans isomerase